MKNILNYQTSEFDCGPTTLCNGIRYLFDREQVTPELLKAISLYTLDAYNEKGETGRSGTSRMAMKFMSSWFNQYGKTNKFPIYSEFLEEEQVYIGQNSRIVNCIQQGGVVVVRVLLEGEDHYVLMTEVRIDVVGIFDPYDMTEYGSVLKTDIEIVENRPKNFNRLVASWILNSESEPNYSLGAMKAREAMLIYNTDTRKTENNAIEYII